MRKTFENPEITISIFSAEYIVTTSGLSPAAAEVLLKEKNSGVKLDGKGFAEDATNILSIIL